MRRYLALSLPGLKTEAGTSTQGRTAESTEIENEPGSVKRRAALARPVRSTFYFWWAVAAVLTGFIGFIPSFWAPMVHGRHTSPVITIHAFVGSAWLLFMVLQTWFVASGRTVRHRDWGLLGIALATLMVVFGVMAAIDQTQRAAAVGALDAGLSFMIVPMTQVFNFATFFTCAIVSTRRPEWHKRFLVMATAILMDAPVGRFLLFYFVFRGHLPVPAGMPSPPPPVDSGNPVVMLLIGLFVIVPMIHDWRTRGWPHPAYLIGVPAGLLMSQLKPAISRTETWHTIAAWIFSLAG